MVTLSQLQHSFDEAGEQYAVLPIGDGMQIMVTQRGARVLGIFPTPESDNLLWTNAALHTAEGVRAFRESGDWNMGGERCWIAPEIQYNITDRTRFFETLRVPPQMDPAQYSFDVMNGKVRLQTTMALEAHVLAEGMKQLVVERTIGMTEGIRQGLYDARDLLDKVTWGGYTQTATLKDSNDTDIVSEIWNLVQVNAGGTLIIPCKEPLGVSDYFGSPTDETRHIERGALRIPITGKRQFKVGYKATSMKGDMGYYRELGDVTASLLLRSFVNNPANPYAEEPPDGVGVNGHSVHVYNDDGGLGGDHSFGEMECTGTTIGRSVGNTEATDRFQMFVFVGAPKDVQAIAVYMLEVEW
jgi:hypothetical protein